MSSIFYAGMIPFYLGCFTWTEGFDGVVLFGWEQNTNLRTVIVSNPAAQAIYNVASAGVTDCATNSAPSIGMGEAVRLDPTPASFGQFIEVTVADLFQLQGAAADFRSEIQVFNFGMDPNTATPGGNFAWVRWEGDIEKLSIEAWSQDSAGFFAGDDPGAITYEPWAGSRGDLTIRLETYNTGRMLLILSDAIVGDQQISFTDATGAVPGPGFHQGITMWWDVHFGSCGDATSPRIISAIGGELCAPEPP